MNEQEERKLRAALRVICNGPNRDSEWDDLENLGFVGSSGAGRPDRDSVIDEAMDTIVSCFKRVNKDVIR